MTSTALSQPWAGIDAGRNGIRPELASTGAGVLIAAPEQGDRFMPSTRFASGILLAGMALAGAGTARAAPDGPPLMPTRDVLVLYSVMPEGAPQAQAVRVYFRGGGGAMRIDGPPGPDGTSSGDMILDRAARTMTIVLNQPRIFMQIPERDEVRSPFVLDASMQFTRTGTGSVAGIPCVQWSIVSGKGNATGCITADGVVLSEEGVDGEGARGKLVAQTVQYGPLAPTLFTPPPGFQRTAHPEGMGAGGPGSSAAGAGGPMLTGPQAGVPNGP
jgi:hypothetical protein